MIYGILIYQAWQGMAVSSFSMYLTAALAGTESAYLKQFVGVSVVLLSLLYLLFSISGMIRRGGIR